MATASVGNGNLEDLERDVEALLREHQHQRRRSSAVGRERELNIFRSGSAPPTVEGSRNAISSIFGGPGIDRTNGYDAGLGLSEEEMRSHPAYLSYYYSNENLNPRLPPPSLSKEDWRVAQRFQVGASAFGRIGDRREEVVGDGVSGGSSSSLFSLQSGFHMRDVGTELAQRSIGSRRNSVRQPSAEWIEGGSGGLIRLPDLGVGLRKQSFTDELQVNGRGETGGHCMEPLHSAH